MKVLESLDQVPPELLRIRELAVLVVGDPDQNPEMPIVMTHYFQVEVITMEPQFPLTY